MRVRSTFARQPRSVRLNDLHRRLELVLTEAYGRPIVIAANELGRGSSGKAMAALMRKLTTASLEGEVIRLPEEIETAGDQQRGAERYRLLAIEQAERLARGTSNLAPTTDPLERDLYLLREGASIDAQIARQIIGDACTSPMNSGGAPTSRCNVSAVLTGVTKPSHQNTFCCRRNSGVRSVSVRPLRED